MAKKNKNKPPKPKQCRPVLPGRDSSHVKIFQQALTFQMSGDIANALACYDRAIALNPDFADAHFNRGIALRDLGRFDEALACYDRVIALDPDAAEAHYNRGNALQILRRFDEALSAYQRAVSLKPGYIEAYNNRGIAFKTLGRYEEALADFDRVIGFKPGFAPAHNNRGTVLEKLGRVEEALTAYERACVLKPDYAEAYNNKGSALKETGRNEEALAAFERACAVKPDYAEAHNNRGIVLKALGRLTEALAAYDRAVHLNPGAAQTHNNRGTILKELGRNEEALSAFERACAVDPAYAEAHNNRGIALRHLERYEEALAAYDRACALNPSYAEAYNNRGIALRNLGRNEEALAAYDRAIAAKPDYVEPYSNRGVALKEMGRFEEALACYDRAIAINPAHAEAYSNRGAVLHDARRYDEALDAFDRASRLNPSYADSQWNKSLLLLLHGRYEEGWRLYEWRRKVIPSAAREFDKPFWSGEADLQGKTILLYHEQGFGDTLQMLRYLPLLVQKGAKILAEVPQALVSLLRAQPEIAQVIVRGEALPDFDCQCAFMSLPLVFRTTLNNIPSAVPYLKVPEDKASVWKGRLGAKSRLRVGLAWSGAMQHKNDANRSIPLPTLLPLLEKKAEFHSLQVEYRVADRDFLKQDGRMIDHAGEIKDFADTAALISEMDVIITVDTSVAHLAGALGKPVFILLPYVPDFRWLLDRSDSPWYPTARLYRQTDFAAWGPAIGQVERDLSSAFPEAGDASNDALSLYNDANTLMAAKQHREALKAYDRALAAEPSFPEALNNRGIALQHLQRYEEALESFRQAVAVRPEFALAQANLAIVLQQLGRPEEALAAWNRTIDIQPDNAEAHNRRGLVLQNLGRYEEALASWTRAVELNPNYVEAHNNRGGALQALKRYDEALQAWQAALTISPAFTPAYINCGIVFQELKHFEDALVCFDHAVAVNPALADAHNSRGFALLQLGRLTEALAAFDRALALDAGFVKAHSNRGYVLQELQRFDEALEAYNRAISLDPSYADAQWNKGLLLLLQGQFEEGWRLYEWRRKVVPAAARNFTRSFWSGEADLQGKTILIYHEQGFGDTLQMLRYLPLLAQKGAKILAEVPQALVSLLRAQPEIAQVIVRGEALPDFDCQCPFMSLPLAFQTTLDTIPATVPYLKVPEDKTSLWKERLGDKTGFRIGLAWSGTAQHKNDANRSIPLSAFLPLLEKKAEFHSLQVEYRAADQDFLKQDGRIADHAGDIKDFLDTAALIEAMDVIVTVDTSVAHLAGALGKPVFILLPYVPDFRWLLEREGSPWYPSAKLFRQPKPQNWEDVIAHLATNIT